MSDIVERIRHFITIRNGPARDEDGKPIGTSWQMMLDAADEIERLHAAVLRIDAINDSPARFSFEINEVCNAILRPHLSPQQTSKEL